MLSIFSSKRFFSTSHHKPFEILGVKPPATANNIKLAFLQATKKYHLKSLSQAEFERFCLAYEILTNPALRKKLDNNETIHFNESELSLHLLVMMNRLKQVEEKLKGLTFQEVNLQDKANRSLLYIAARGGHFSIVELLIEKGADPDTPQLTMSTALHAASFYDHAAVAWFLIDRGANISIKNQWGQTPKDEGGENMKKVFNSFDNDEFVQTISGNLEYLKMHLFAIKDGQNKYLDNRNSSGQTKLFCSAKHGHLHIVEWLFELAEREGEAMNIDAVDNHDRTPLHAASYHGHADIVKCLLEHGANPAFYNAWGITPEAEAANKQVKQEFINIRTKDPFDNISSKTTIWYQHFLPKQDIDLMYPNRKFKTLLHDASAQGNIKLVVWLLNLGANVFIADADSRTALHYAIINGHKSTTEMLLLHRASISLKDVYHKTPLDYISNSDEYFKSLFMDYPSKKLTDPYQVKFYLDSVEPIATSHINSGTTLEEVFKQLPIEYQKLVRQFSYGGRVVPCDNKNDSFLSVVCAVRHAHSSFIELPICVSVKLDKSKQPLSKALKCRPESLPLHIIAEERIPRYSERVTVRNLLVTFPKGFTSNSSTLIVYDTKALPTQYQESIQVLFKLNVEEFDNEKLPIVELIGSNKAQSIFFYSVQEHQWFGTGKENTVNTLMPNMLHTLSCKTRVTDTLRLHRDMFISIKKETGTIKNLYRRIEISGKKHSSSEWDTGYHGTKIEYVESIVRDGLLKPGNVTTSGSYIAVPKSHISRNEEVFGVQDFATSVFITPSIHYAAHPVYAGVFTHDNLRLIPVFECKFRKGTYQQFRSTTPSYKPRTGDPKNLEWRVDDINNVEISALLLLICVAVKPRRVK